MREKEEQGKKKPSGSAMRGVRGEPGGAAMAAPGRSWRGRSNGRPRRGFEEEEAPGCCGGPRKQTTQAELREW